MSLNKSSKRFTGLFLPLILIVCWLFLLDYSDFWSRQNIAGFLGVSAMILLIVGFFSGKKY
jgi:uncharacterized membrane protein